MISEPELEGGAPFETAEVLTEERPPRLPQGRRPWLWGLAGAVLASAVWGAGLYAYERKADPGPDLGGYKPVDAPCDLAELKALGAVLGKRSGGGTGPVLDTPVLSEASCSVGFGPEATGQSVDISYTLHKVTDPGPEFAARAEQHGYLGEIEGVGEQAFFEDQGEEGGRMWILDGQAELRIEIYRQQSFDEHGNPIGTGPALDLSGIDVPMSQDALALIAALKK
ncbi:hypothetical protein ACFVU3_12845 [Streptomyces sp. NPDC058052]|uniref:hypothetical protein n=1 Tax=Streptomyces sp. NPDC058052 TaxID=3346316 RepID=UPI0036E97A9A